jgi:anthranilate synthase/aminodeoxychorismate synthase-like glutamine amidotransferase
MFFLLDNNDSFVYNLSAYFQELGQEILVKRPHEITLSEIEKMDFEGIILSPGPGRPSEAVLSLQIIEKMKGKIPILGVCLGHQAIGYYFGARVEKGNKPMHGKLTYISHKGKRLFQGLPEKFKVTRYHSLVVYPENILSAFYIDALSEDGAVMSISHKEFPIYGVQFHPEAVLTEYGHALIDNFIKICSEWREEYENNRRA